MKKEEFSEGFFRDRICFNVVVAVIMHLVEVITLIIRLYGECSSKNGVAGGKHKVQVDFCSAEE